MPEQKTFAGDISPHDGRCVGKFLLKMLYLFNLSGVTVLCSHSN